MSGDTSELRTVSLTMRLLRQDKTVNDAFKDEEKSGVTELRATPGEQVRIFAGQVYSNPPDWAKFISNKIAVSLPPMQTSGATGILFYPVGEKGERTIAICFGHSHIPLNLNAFDRQFGLRVTLNTVPRSKLRTLDIATPDAITFQRRIQASRDSDLREFGIDILRDLARVAGGTPLNQKFAKFVAGRDSLSLTCRINPEAMGEKCQEAFRAYQSEEYKKDFSWIDNLNQVREKETLTVLDAKLMTALSALRQGKSEDLHMAPPEIVDYTEGGIIHYNGFGSHGVDFHRLCIDDYIRELDRCGFADGILEIKENHRIKAAKPGSDKLTERWRVYDCFIYEAEIKKDKETKKYVLFSGEWYEVKQSFRDEIEKEFQILLSSAPLVTSTTSANEQELIAELEKRQDLVKLDRQKINPDGVKYANLEPCDFFSEKKQFIHLKDGHSSGPISHLWMQGVVSAEAFISDKKFRQDLRKTVKRLKPGFEDKLPKASQDPERRDYEVVFGIMRQPYKDGSIGLPFFSKVSLRAAVERLKQLGFPVSIHIIKKEDAFSEDQGLAEAA